MTTFILIPGAGGDPWYWHRVVPLLQAAGHEAVAVALPGNDPQAGLPEYTDIVVETIGAQRDVVLVAQSLGGFTAPLVADTVPVRALILVNAMIPSPGETPGEWWSNTESEAARRGAAHKGGYPTEFDPEVYFLHDVPTDVLKLADHEPFEESDAVFGCPCTFVTWPDVPTRVIVGQDDRFFPAEFQHSVARARLGLGVDTVPGGHLVALSQPREVADRLLIP